VVLLLRWKAEPDAWVGSAEIARRVWPASERRELLYEPAEMARSISGLTSARALSLFKEVARRTPSDAQRLVRLVELCDRLGPLEAKRTPRRKVVAREAARIRGKIQEGKHREVLVPDRTSVNQTVHRLRKDLEASPLSDAVRIETESGSGARVWLAPGTRVTV